jgi:shikimate dehydrogenase
MSKYGLVGFPLKNDFSLRYFTEKFRQASLPHVYGNYPISEIGMIRDIVNKNGLSGINVTIPYKQLIIPFLTKIDNDAKDAHAVNTILISGHEWIGYNTDVPAFQQSFSTFIGNTQGKALILGNGGASAAVQLVLQRLCIPYLIVNRHDTTDGLTYHEITKEIMQEYRFIINTTPVGMSPDWEHLPNIPLEWITPEHKVYDLIYTPDPTLLLSTCASKGASVKSGIEMLHLQADLAFKIWTKGA